MTSLQCFPFDSAANSNRWSRLRQYCCKSHVWSFRLGGMAVKLFNSTTMKPSVLYYVGCRPLNRSLPHLKTPKWTKYFVIQLGEMGIEKFFFFIFFFFFFVVCFLVCNVYHSAVTLALHIARTRHRERYTGVSPLSLALSAQTLTYAPSRSFSFTIYGTDTTSKACMAESALPSTPITPV